MVHSRYDEGKVVWKGNLTQEDALAFSLDNQDETERDIMEGVQSELMENPTEDIIRPTNPCHFGLIFSGFQIGKQGSN